MASFEVQSLRKYFLKYTKEHQPQNVLGAVYQPLYAFFPLWPLLTYEGTVLSDPDIEYRSGRVAGHLTRNLHLVAEKQKYNVEVRTENMASLFY
jgi:hypothetical protein